MSTIEIIGYIGALLVGLIMGLTGSGGSVLSVPILAYLFGHDEKTATAYSLFIVGMTALFRQFQSFEGEESQSGIGGFLWTSVHHWCGHCQKSSTAFDARYDFQHFGI